MEMAGGGKVKRDHEYKHLLEELDREMNLLIYAISHDLRAPLRSIQGFSQAVIEDYGDALDETGKDFLSRVQNAGKRLDRCIEALLHMSRETRCDMVPEPVDLSIVAREVAAELKECYPDRKVEFTVGKNAEGVLSRVDRRLIKVALEKLLDNAWKFTLGREHAHVEFGVVEEPDRRMYFVADNGIGFDERYAESRLFGVFQRMHSNEAFEGQGMGLATARRIISRHHGRIWAKSEVNKGTVVHFTLTLPDND